MPGLIDKIIFDHKRYAETTDPRTRQEIEKIASKLKPLEAQILDHPEGNIAILNSGNILITSFPGVLTSQINEIISST